MELKDRISATLDYADLSASAFAKKIGVKTTQAIYDLLSGKTRTLSSDILNKVVSCYPMLSVEWLMTGEGDMIKPSEIAAQRELVAQSMAQTAMLIQLLQNQK